MDSIGKKRLPSTQAERKAERDCLKKKINQLERAVKYKDEKIERLKKTIEGLYRKDSMDGHAP